MNATVKPSKENVRCAAEAKSDKKPDSQALIEGLNHDLAGEYQSGCKMKFTHNEQARKSLLVNWIKADYERATRGRHVNSEQLKVLEEAPLSELEPLLKGMQDRDGNEAEKFCIATIYSSRDKRLFDELRNSLAAETGAKNE